MNQDSFDQYEEELDGFGEEEEINRKLKGMKYCNSIFSFRCED